MNTDPLPELALTIQEYSSSTDPKKIALKRKAMTAIHQYMTSNREFFSRIERSLGAKYGGLSRDAFEECFQEALAKTWLKLLTFLEQDYDPNRGTVWGWFEETLKRRFGEVRNEYQNSRRTRINGVSGLQVNQSLERVIYSEDATSSTALVDLIPSPETTDSLSDAKTLIDIIREDRYQVFQKKHLKDSPEANYQKIVLMRYEQKSWEDIASELKRNIGAITPFVSRSHQYFRPLLYESLQGEFWLSDETQTLIREDSDNKFKKISTGLLERSGEQKILITFQQLISIKLQHSGLDWPKLTEKLGISPDVTDESITFHLTSISSLKGVFQGEFNL